MRRALALALSLAVLPGTTHAADAPRPEGAAAQKRSPEALLADGRLAYERGDYPLAVSTIAPLLYPIIELATEDAVIEAHRVLALSYLLQKKEPEAEEEATTILALKPSFQLDPIVDPPMAVAFFESVRKRQDARLREARDRERREAEARAKAEAEERRAKAERIYIERSVEKHSRFIATLPFGVGQWQNGQKTKAALFLTGELVFGVASLAGYIALGQKFPGGVVQASDSGVVDALGGLQLGAGAAFWALVVWGIIDAHVLYKPEVVRTRELPKGALKSLMFSPILGNTQAGLAVQGAF